MITGRFASAVAECDGIALQCVHSRDRARAEAAAERLGAARASSDWGALLTSEDVDALYIASPNALHAGQAMDAIAAGKHVLIEKPACTTPQALLEVVSASRAAGVIALEAIRSLYDPGYTLIHDLLPRLGPLRRASFRFHQRSARYDRVLAGERVNVFDPVMGGGALLDLGVYCVHALVDLLGEPEKVMALDVRIAGGADGAGAAIAAYPGLVADISYSKITLGDTASSISGEAGTLQIDHIDDPRGLAIEWLDGSREEFAVAKAGPDQLANMVNCVDHFVAAVEGRTDVSRDQDRSIAVARVMAAMRSASSDCAPEMTAG
jgi:predicted dehydrogenase